MSFTIFATAHDTVEDENEGRKLHFMLAVTMFSISICVKYSILFVVIFMVVCLLFDSSSAIQISLSRPLVFSHGAAIAPLQYSREYLLNLQYGHNNIASESRI